MKKGVGEEMWKMCAEREYLAGIFLWTGMDYRGEPTPLGYPAVFSQFGIFDYCGFPKDNYYYYKSWWQEERVLHLLPHWNHQGREGQILKVYCYSNLDEVELFVNGRSYGRKQMERNWYLVWEDVVYEPGELRAVGYRKGEAVKEELVRTAKEPSRIRLTAYRTEIGAGETAVINVELLDEEGTLVPDADREVGFRIGEGGILLGTGNGNPGSHENEKLPFRRTFHGKCQLLVRAAGTGEIEISAGSEGIAEGICTLTVDLKE